MFIIIAIILIIFIVFILTSKIQNTKQNFTYDRTVPVGGSSWYSIIYDMWAVPNSSYYGDGYDKGIKSYVPADYDYLVKTKELKYDDGIASYLHKDCDAKKCKN